MNWHLIRKISKQSKKSGMAPGTMVHVGERKTEQVTISCISYNKDVVFEQDNIQFEKIPEYIKSDCVNWLNIDGLHEISVIQEIGRLYDIHPLVLEDIVNTGQRPKYEDYESYLFIVLKMLSYDRDSHSIKSEQVSVILINNLVITFQEQSGDVFDSIRIRIRNDKGRIRKLNADYMAYSLLDAIVDSYYSILETEADLIEKLEDQVFVDPQPDVVHKIHTIKGDLHVLRKANWASREMLGSLVKNETGFFSDTTMPYMLDVFDHSNGVADSVDTFREMLSSLLDLYLSSVSHKMNSVMKVLTIIATIFIPLTFIAGIYGMNFDYMPECDWKWGYPTVLAVMGGLGFVMLMLFKRNRWF